MSQHKYTGMHYANGLLSIGKTEYNDEHEAFVRLEDVRAVEVNWTVESGRIYIITAWTTYMVSFTDDDAGQECADMISDLVRAMSVAPDVAVVPA